MPETNCSICGGSVNISKKNYVRMVLDEDDYQPVCRGCKGLANFASTNATLDDVNDVSTIQVHKGKLRRRRN
jgi:hypothetical protein